MTAIAVCDAAPGSDEWLGERPKGIGASEVATVIGANPYQTAVDLWRTKMGMDPGFTGNYASRRGQHLESFVIAAWAEQNPGYIVETAPDDIPSMMAHPDHPEIRCSLDALVHNRDESACLEIKTAGYRQRSKWDDGQMPDAYIIQAQYQMLVTGLDVTYIGADVAGEFVQRVVPRNDALCEHLRMTVTDWWWQHCHPDGPKQMPAPDPIRDRDTLAKLWTPDPTKDVTLDPDLLARLRDTKAALAAAKTDHEIAAAEVQLAMREACTGYDDAGEVAVRWNPSKGRESIDAKALRADHPDIAAQYTRTGESGRRFTVSN